MKKVFEFIESLKPTFYEVLGYPTIKVYSDMIEVYFDTSSIIRDLSIFDLTGPDEFRMFPNDSQITCVFTFYTSLK